jgi:hypothetical protein
VTTCGCGCGRETTIAKVTRPARGHIKGQPTPFIRGHNANTRPEPRFWAQVDKTEDCWIWTGFVGRSGYGYISVRGLKKVAHRYGYELTVGPIPDGLQLDHLCRVRTCVNPAHLEPVTLAENVRRGNAPSAISARTDVCPNGHEGKYERWSSGARFCRECRREASRRRYWNARNSPAEVARLQQERAS